MAITCLTMNTHFAYICQVQVPCIFPNRLPWFITWCNVRAGNVTGGLTSGARLSCGSLLQIYRIPGKYAHSFCFAVLCCGYTLTDFPISIRLTSLALWQSNDCPSASKATLMNMDKYFMWIHYERLHNHNKAKHNKTVCIFLGIYCTVYPANMHTVLSYIVLLWLYYQFCCSM